MHERMVPEHLEPHERKGGGCRQNRTRSPGCAVFRAPPAVQRRGDHGDHDGRRQRVTPPGPNVHLDRVEWCKVDVVALTCETIIDSVSHGCPHPVRPDHDRCDHPLGHPRPEPSADPCGRAQRPSEHEPPASEPVDRRENGDARRERPDARRCRQQVDEDVGGSSEERDGREPKVVRLRRSGVIESRSGAGTAARTPHVNGPGTEDCDERRHTVRNAARQLDRVGRQQERTEQRHWRDPTVPPPEPVGKEPQRGDDGPQQQGACTSDAEEGDRRAREHGVAVPVAEVLVAAGEPVAPLVGLERRNRALTASERGAPQPDRGSTTAGVAETHRQRDAVREDVKTPTRDPDLWNIQDLLPLDAPHQ